MNKLPLVSVCIPTYNSEKYIINTLNNILGQNYQNIEIIISDDCSTDNTIQKLKSIKNTKIKIYKNRKNLGYGKNLQQFRKYLKGEIIFLIGQDDVIINDDLKLTIQQFIDNPQVGVVTRPYYWFIDNIKIPVRHIPPINSLQNELIDINTSPEKIIPIIESLGQLSGLAYKTKWMTRFNENVFPSHIYPFMKILKNHLCVFLKDYTIAVSVVTSQTRFKPSIYNNSPLKTWVDMLNKIFPKKTKYHQINKLSINHMSQHYLGLIQIKNYSSFNNLIREIVYFIKYRWQNIFSPLFWFFALGTIITPKCILIFLVDNYKKNLTSSKLNKIKI